MASIDQKFVALNRAAAACAEAMALGLERSQVLAKSATFNAAKYRHRQEANAQLALLAKMIDRLRRQTVIRALQSGEIDGEQLKKLGVPVDLEKIGREDATVSIARLHRRGPGPVGPSSRGA